MIEAEKELRNAWQYVDEDKLRKEEVQSGMNWIFGSACPRCQGALESLIKIAKRAVIFAVRKRRLSDIIWCNRLSDDFWEEKIQLYAPTLVIQRKWNVNTRNLRLGDVVIVADINVLRGQYRLGMVKEVFPDVEGKVRRVLDTYKNVRVGNIEQKYYGVSNTVTVSRSAHRLALLVPVDYSKDEGDD